MTAVISPVPGVTRLAIVFFVVFVLTELSFVFVLVVSLVIIAPCVVVIVIVVPIGPSLIHPGPFSACITLHIFYVHPTKGSLLSLIMLNTASDHCLHVGHSHTVANVASWCRCSLSGSIHEVGRARSFVIQHNAVKYSAIPASSIFI